MQKTHIENRTQQCYSESSTHTHSVFIMAWILFCLFCTYPFAFNRIVPLPNITILIACSFVVYYFVRSKTYHLPSIITRLLKVQTLGVFILLLFSGDVEYIKQFLYIIWCFFIIYFIGNVSLKKFLFCFNRFILIIAILGVVSFWLSLFLGPNIYLQYENMDGRPAGLVYLTLTNTVNLNIIRYCGVFDEPGAMAFWGIFSLITNKIYVKDWKLEKPLVISLFFTLSLAYIIQIGLYFIFFYFHSVSYKVKVLSIIICATLVLLLYFNIDKDSLVFQLTFGRLGLGGYGGVLEGSNRDEMMLLSKKYFMSSPLWGVGPTAFYGGEYAADNPYETLAKDGIIGTIFMYLPLLVAMKITKYKKEIVCCVIILATGYLQRPFHINITHYTMLYCFLFACYRSYKNLRYEKNQYNYRYIQCRERNPKDA